MPLSGDHKVRTLAIPCSVAAQTQANNRAFEVSQLGKIRPHSQPFSIDLVTSHHKKLRALEEEFARLSVTPFCKANPKGQREDQNHSG